MAPFVSVVVPAYNAAATIAETLASASAQTYRHLEILVVDDGSRDATVEIVEAHRERDPRVVLLRKANGGVASARNLGIERARGAYVAPLDADDHWHPLKTERQVAALEAAGQDVAVAYSPYRRIDGQGRVIGRSPVYGCEGRVLFRHMGFNFVGNGSGMLVRRDPVVALGGYDASLRARGGEGCEDLLLQLKLAVDHRFVCVPDYLVGYRELPGNMSSDDARMSLAHLLVLDDLCDWIGPGIDPAIRLCADRLAMDFAERLLFRRGYRAHGRAVLLAALRRHPRAAGAAAAGAAWEKLRLRGVRGAAKLARLGRRPDVVDRAFLDFAIDEAPAHKDPDEGRISLRTLEALDHAAAARGDDPYRPARAGGPVEARETGAAARIA
ncbi:MAG: glycosyltransferase [Azospirillaceae bacterium]